MTVSTGGELELKLRLDQIPRELRAKILERIKAFTAALEERVRAAAPVRTGRLRSEIVGRVFEDNPQRVAGYVEIYAPGLAGEYAKAATLEYGTDKARRLSVRRGSLLERLHGKRLSISSGVVHIAPRRYLRGPFEELRPQIQAALDEVLAENQGEI